MDKVKKIILKILDILYLQRLLSEEEYWEIRLDLDIEKKEK